MGQTILKFEYLKYKKMKHSVKFLVDNLYSVGSLKFGNFKLKSGKFSSYYVNLRILISYPKLLNLASILLYDLFIRKKS